MKLLRLCSGRPFLLAAILAVGGSARCRAAGTVLYSGGDVTNSTYAYNVKSPSAQSESELYQQFIVPAGQTWTVSTIALHIVTDGIAASSITQADYEIRKGVSSGNGGTLLYSGTTSITGVDDHLSSGNGELYLFSGAPKTTVTLSAGTYWLAFVPYSPSNTNLFAAGNNGNDTLNKPASPSNYISGYANGASTGSFESYSFSAAEELLGSFTSTAVPEPSTWALLLLGTGGLWMVMRRRVRHTEVARARPALFADHQGEL